MVERILPHITSAASWDVPKPYTVNLVFTWQGFKALGIPDRILDSFPEEFRAGMAARAEILGDTGKSAPEHWVQPLGRNDVHIGVVISAGSEADLAEPIRIAMAAYEGIPGIEPIYRIDVGVPSTGREHFGFRDGIGSVSIIGSEVEPLPGQDPVMPGEFILGYPDETGSVAPMPQPEVLGKNGAFLAFRQMYCDVGAFRRYLQANARNKDDEELLAAKMVGRWRSGAPLSLSPEKDDPALGADPLRNNDFRYHEDDPRGLKCPLGSHIRRCNPRDGLAGSIVNVNRHRLIRRGSAYGPELPADQLQDDGVDRGIVFIFMGASLIRQFEFIQQAWINNGDFVGLGEEVDPLVGPNTGHGTHTIPARPIRRRLTGLPRFVTVRGGEYCFLPSLSALRWLSRGQY